MIRYLFTKSIFFFFFPADLLAIICHISTQLQDSHDHFNPGIIEVIATDLGHLTEPYEEVFGGDLSHVTTAMQEAVKQVDEHIHEVQPEQANHLVHRVNQVQAD